MDLAIQLDRVRASWNRPELSIWPDLPRHSSSGTQDRWNLQETRWLGLADHPDGPLGKPCEPFTRDWVEGPSPIKIKDEYLVYFDRYAQPHDYSAVRLKDLMRWEDCSNEMWFPKDQRHGTVLKIPHTIARLLLARH
jgi:hypothetical protein